MGAAGSAPMDSLITVAGCSVGERPGRGGCRPATAQAAAPATQAPQTVSSPVRACLCRCRGRREGTSIGAAGAAMGARGGPRGLQGSRGGAGFASGRCPFSDLRARFRPCRPRSCTASGRRGCCAPRRSCAPAGGRGGLRGALRGRRRRRSLARHQRPPAPLARRAARPLRPAPQYPRCRARAAAAPGRASRAPAAGHEADEAAPAACGSKRFLKPRADRALLPPQLHAAAEAGAGHLQQRVRRARRRLRRPAGGAEEGPRQHRRPGGGRLRPPRGAHATAARAAHNAVLTPFFTLRRRCMRCAACRTPTCAPLLR